MKRFPSSRLVRLVREAFPQPRRNAPERKPFFTSLLGITSDGPVLPGAECRMTLVPRRDFYPSTLFVPSDIALDFMLEGLDIDGEDFQEEGPISCAEFSEVAIQAEWECCFPAGSVVTVTVRNVSNIQQYFHGAFRASRSRMTGDDSGP